MTSGLRETATALRADSLSARAYCEGLLARVRERDPQVHAWASIDDRRALALANDRDARTGAPRAKSALHGIPLGVKDIIDTADLPTQMGSPVFEGHRPARNAPVIDRLLAAGAYVLGKTVTTEFAFMHPGKTRNPWNAAHTPGGSSSGSAAAVAAGMVPGAIGTQTNGSVIRPAAFCGVVGFKPTFGLIPSAGTLQFSAALDQLGVFTRSVADAALLASVVAEAGSIAPEVSTMQVAPRIAFLEKYPWNTAEPDAAAEFQRTLQRFSAAGAAVAELRLAGAFDDAQQVHRKIMVYEGARQHAPRQAQHRGLMSAELNAVIDDGLGISDAEYARALAKAGEIRARALDLFGQCDVIASLPAPGVAPARLDTTGDPSFCTLWSLTGSPALTLPTGLSSGGLPFGIQLAARTGADDALLRIARWCELAIGFDRDPF